MSKLMYANFNGIKNEQHIPDAVAKSELKNGYVVVKGVGEAGEHTATLPSSLEECKGELWFVHNVIDKPELDNDADYVIKEGEFARIWKFKADYPVYVSADLISGKPVVGQYLVADESNFGKLKASATNEEYAVALLVREPMMHVSGTLYICDVVLA